MDPSDGKSRKEKVSGLRYFLATSRLLKATGKDEIPLGVGSPFRQKFVEAVGEIVRIDFDTHYSRDFANEFDQKKDFQVGSNFFTTRLANSRSRDVLYPGRPASLLLLSQESASLLDESINNLHEFYGINEVKAELAIWLLRRYDFPVKVDKVEAEFVHDMISHALENTFTTDVAKALTPSLSRLKAIFDDIDFPVFVKAPEEIFELINVPVAQVEEENQVKVLTDDLDDDDPIYQITLNLLSRGSKGILFSGPPGTSKSWYAVKVALKIVGGSLDKLERVQFHPSFSYEDFIEGLISTGSIASDKPLFEPKPKIFLKLCEKAKSDPDSQYILIVDEFTRGDPSKIFGELLTYIEADYRDVEFRLPYSEKVTSIPHNVIIIATMNPYDKSVVDLDSAMERRFEIIELLPNPSILKGMLENNNVGGPKLGNLVKFFRIANEHAPHGFGHTYFKDCKTDQDLVLLWNHKLRFIFEKMFRYNEDSYTEVKNAFIAILDDEQKEKIQ